MKRNLKFLYGWASFIFQSSANESVRKIRNMELGKINLSSSDKAGVAANHTQACDFTYVKCCFSFFPCKTNNPCWAKPETSVRAVVRNAAIWLVCELNCFAACARMYACTHVCGWQECAGCSNWAIRSQQEAQVSTDTERCDETQRKDLQPVSFISSGFICECKSNSFGGCRKTSGQRSSWGRVALSRWLQGHQAPGSDAEQCEEQ